MVRDVRRHGRPRARLARRPHARAAQPARAPRRAHGAPRRPRRPPARDGVRDGRRPSPSATPCRRSPARSGPEGTCASSAARRAAGPVGAGGPRSRVPRRRHAARLEARARRPAPASRGGVRHRRALPRRPHRRRSSDAFAVAARALVGDRRRRPSGRQRSAARRSTTCVIEAEGHADRRPRQGARPGGADRPAAGHASCPPRASMSFDTADLAQMEADGSLVRVIMHEMAHVLGFGSIWDRLGLLQGAGSANPTFTGAARDPRVRDPARRDRAARRPGGQRRRSRAHATRTGARPCSATS